MATSREMRKFAADCLRWSAETKNASHRDLMKQMAKSWTKTASAIERRVQGRELELPALRNKLN